LELIVNNDAAKLLWQRSEVNGAKAIRSIAKSD
jgi:hypothetical protein